MCSTCAGHEVHAKRPVITMDDVHAAVAGHALCLAKPSDYKNCQSKLPFECMACGHRWEATWSSIRKGSRCLKCQNRLPPTLSEIQAAVAGRAICHAAPGDYKNQRTKLPLECLACGHRWTATWSNIQKGRGCGKCAGNVPPTQADIARELDGWARLRPEKGDYRNAHSKLHLECLVCGHEWSPTWNSIKNGYRCPKCAKRLPPTLSDIQQKVEGVALLLSAIEDYETAHSPLRFQCLICFHEWAASWNNIHKGQGCPACRYKGERFVRNFFATVLQLSLQPASPQWLSGFGPRTCRLDGYNEAAKLAFEYHGPQHYREIPYLHRRAGDFVRQQERDCFVRERCLEQGVILLEVMHVVGPVTPKKVVEHCTPYAEAYLGTPVSQDLISQFLASPGIRQGAPQIH